MGILDDNRILDMSDEEIRKNVLGAANQKAQIKICAELNATTEEVIKNKLKAQGVDLRSLKGVKRQIDHGTKHKPHKKSTKAEKISTNAENITVAQACAVLIARVDELKKQKKAIEAELEVIEAQIGRVSDSIGEALLGEVE